MKFSPRLLILVFAGGICLHHLISVANAGPKESPVPTPAVSPPPSSPVPSGSPRVLVLPIPSAAPTRAPEVRGTPSFPVPPPKPDPVFQRPPAGDVAASVRGAPQLPDLDLAVPEVEVWRAESRAPQMPARRGRRFELAYLVGKEPGLIRLRFHPLASGHAVIVQPGPGVTVDPPETEFRVGQGGECVVSVALDKDFLRSDLNVYCAGVKTKVPVSRASLEIVEAKEAAGRGGR